jgi:four helix bundle protein
MEKLELGHKNLDVWVFSKNLVKEIYIITESFPKSELYGIISQIRRAAVSVICNLSEGSARKSTLERKRFYEISRSSLVEIDTLLEISFDLSYINKEIYDEINAKVLQIFKMTTKLIQKT